MKLHPLSTALVAAVCAAFVAACTTPPAGPAPKELDAQALTMIRSSFRDQGIAKVDRLDQDALQRLCSSDKPPAEADAKRVEAAELAQIVWPADGQYMGDWRRGEKLAQDGRGMTWSDKSAAASANGGNCYNCHQLDPKEVSYGTIGPSLYQYAKLRGVKDPADPAAREVVRYTWGKLWNSKAYAACSNMPRFGAHKLLDEAQLRDLMALLLDPKSPVNQ
jgi:sulfur-oxidizing protein SoxX